VRRHVCGGELGGARNSAYASSAFLVFLWTMYITLSIIQAQGAIPIDMDHYPFEAPKGVLTKPAPAAGSP
jgi:hypothetical protein